MEVPVRVIARVRPCTQQEQNQGSCVAVAPASSQVILGYDHFCDFDAVFGPDVTQKDLYTACLADLVLNFFQGYNVTVLGYGQRGSGKTYSLTGPDFLWAMNEEEFGLLPQAVRHVFNLMRACPGREYRIHVSYLVVQRDAVYDLLSSTNSYTPLNVLEDNTGSVVIPGLNVIDCSNITEVINCLEAGLVHRHTAAIHNHDPATSHAIFSLILEHQWNDADGKLKYLYSRMNFVDLGGSERLMQFGYDFGLNEDAFFLNSDLKALSNVIHCLADPSYTGPIPYSESRLTHILKDAFGGNSLSLMLCCLSPTPKDFEATFHTLKYGCLARYICNYPTVNVAVQNSVRTSSATVTPSSTHTTLRQSSSRQSTVTAPQSSVPHSLATNDTSNPPPPDDTASTDNEEAFRLQFAASQWQLLVSSAEDLLSEILQSTQVSPSDKLRIESWLCMKAEAEECLGADTGLLRFNNTANRVLEVIEELSEPEVNGSTSPMSVSSRSESDASSTSSLGEEFYDQLAVLANKFRSLTDQLVEGVEDRYDTFSDKTLDGQESGSGSGEEEEEEEDGSQSTLDGLPCQSPQGSQQGPATSSAHQPALQGTARRMREGREVDSERCTTNHSLSSLSLGSVPASSLPGGDREMVEGDAESCQGSQESAKDFKADGQSLRRKSSSLTDSKESQVFTAPRKKKKDGEDEKSSLSVMEEMKRLSASQESRRGQVKKVSLELRAAQQRLKQLNATIRLKEAFIRELVRSGGEAEMTQRKCEAKMGRLEKEASHAQQLYHQAQTQLKELRKEESPNASQFRSRVDALKKQISYYQKKLTTLVKVADISKQGDSKVVELEGSVREMRRQQEELQERLKEETQHKEELEQQILHDQRRIRELEGLLKESESEGERGWLAEEEERILKLREATQKLQSEVEQREEAVRQRERMHKLRLQTEHSKAQDGTSEEAAGRRESDIREEISHLRDARDSLMMRRQKLDRRIHRSRGRGVGSGEERRLLELDEAIEAVDATIEYKNEVICGRAKELNSHAVLLNQDNLMDRLMNLCPEETRSLLVKYFNKVIDLRIEFRKQEIAFSDLELQYEEQSGYISDLKGAYQQASLEMERRITSQQREYQQKISTLLRQFNDDSSGSGAHEFRLREMEKQLYYYKKLNRDLKTKIRQTGEGSRWDPQPMSVGEELFDQVGGARPGEPSLPMPPTHRQPPAPPLLPRRTRMQAAEQAAKHPTPQTKVTRERNKIIIQHKSDHKDKTKSGLDPR